MSGKLYGIGIGPGDPQLLTLRAYKLLSQAQVIAVPVKKLGEESTAQNIIRQAVDLKDKTIVALEFPMAHSKEILKESHLKAAARISGYLEQGRDVMLITLGDVSVYSTCTYVLRYVEAMGYESCIVPGIPSFCSGAALAKLPLVEGHENMAVISSIKGTKTLEEALDRFETVVVMKAGRHMNDLCRILKERELVDNTTVISNAGMENQYIGPVVSEKNFGYFTTLIIKQRKN